MQTKPLQTDIVGAVVSGPLKQLSAVRVSEPVSTSAQPRRVSDNDLLSLQTHALYG